MLIDVLKLIFYFYDEKGAVVKKLRHYAMLHKINLVFIRLNSSFAFEINEMKILSCIISYRSATNEINWP